MRLEEFPRPKDDNGRGVHWSASVYHPSGSELDFWLQELQAMQIKWVKLLDDGGSASMELCQRLLEADIMPVVRLYREAPNPGHISGREEETVRRLRDVGVRYFETNNEPDLAGEWQGGHRPDNWLNIVVDNFIFDADRLLALDALPALPAMGPGSAHNALAVVIERGRRDLFERGAWIAIHNYTLNHPLDYPYDPVNQNGQPLIQEEYDALLAEEVEPDAPSFAWDSQPLDLINRWRATDKNPGATVQTDSHGFLGYLRAHEMIEKTLGFDVPIISTEAGPVVGWHDDRRYPRLTPNMHRDWLIRIFRFMQEQAPPWYFAICPWLLASYRMNDFNPTWEQMSWYTNWHDRRFGLQGELPAVAALKELPGRSRVDFTYTGSIEGTVLTPLDTPVTDLSLTLRQHEGSSHSTATDFDGRFRFDRLPPGTYDISMDNQELQKSIDLPEGETVTLALRLGEGRRSQLTGRVVDTEGDLRRDIPVYLLHDGERVAEDITIERGVYTFSDLGGGMYTVEASTARVEKLTLDGWNRVEVDLVIPATVTFRYRVTAKRLLPPDETVGRNIFYGYVYGPDGGPVNGIRLQMRWSNAAPGTDFPEITTGHDPYRPTGYYEFVHTRGDFQIQVIEDTCPSDVADGLLTDGVSGWENGVIAYEVNFQRLPVSPESETRESRIEGHVPGGREGDRLRLHAGEQHWTTTLDPSSRFAFANLGPGLYSLVLEEIGPIADVISLDGHNTFSLTFPMQSRIAGRVLDAPSDTVVKLRAVPWTWQREATLDAGGAFEFTRLPAGTYTTRAVDREVSDLHLDGRNEVIVADIDLHDAGQSAIRGRLVYGGGAPVSGQRLTLYLEDEASRCTETDEQGEFAFANLEAGIYRLEGEVIGMLRQGIPLDGTDETSLDITIPGETGDPTNATEEEKVPEEREGLRKKVHPIERYILFSLTDEIVMRTALLLTEPLLHETGTIGGFSSEEARNAARVILIGDTPDSATEGILKEAGCQVDVLPGDPYQLAGSIDSLRNAYEEEPAT